MTEAEYLAEIKRLNTKLKELAELQMKNGGEIFRLEHENARLRRLLDPCKMCKGQGELDDADPGDTFFRTWKCPHCRGSGTEPNEAPGLQPHAR